MSELDFSAVSPELLLGLKKGDVIEAHGLLPGLLADEPVLVTVSDKDKNGSSFKFTYCGVWLANAKLFRAVEGPKWLM